MHFIKMIADYYRYSVEHTPNPSAAHAKSSEKFYMEGLKIACEDLDPCNPVRLSLALNLAVLYSDIIKRLDKAIVLTTVTL